MGAQHLNLEQPDGTAPGFDENSRAEQLRAVTTVIRRVPEGRYRDEILAALFAPPRKTRYHGSKPSAEWGRARTEWLGRCRGWIESTTGRVLTTSQIPKADQRAYEAATGDVWAPPGPKLPVPRPPLQPCGTPGAYQRHKAHGEPIDEACRRARNAERVAQKQRAKARAA